MRQPLKFELVDTREKFEELKVFAATFNHEVDDTARLPIISVSRGTRQIGYFHVVNVPMIWPAFHTDPAICSPRDTMDFVETVKNYQFLTSLGGRTPNGESHALLPEDLSGGGFTPEGLSKLGYTDLKQKLWHAKG